MSKNTKIRWFTNPGKNDYQASLSYLSLIFGISNGHVEKSTKKIQTGIGLPPLLLVPDERQRRLIIAEGYNRLCSVYLIDEDANIPCKIVY
jgi:hypothetical protein